MKIAVYNIQNIFQRHIDLVGRFQAQNKSRWIAEFETLLLQSERTQKDYERMRVLSQYLGFDKEELAPFFTIRNILGQLWLKRGVNKDRPKATHLTDWEGWARAESLPIDEVAIRNKAKVITGIDPDIIVLLEVEDRVSLVEFNQHFLTSTGHAPYKELIFMGTNDTLGRGIGILAKAGHQLTSIKTHVNDLEGSDKPIFDVDLQEYSFKTSSGRDIDILCTHFVDNNGSPESFRMRQKRQSEHIVGLLAERQKNTSSHTMLMGTLNAPSYSSAISPLIRDTELNDITRHPQFLGALDKGKDADYFRLGAYKMGVNIRQRDYLMLSKNLFEAVERCGLVRKGMWHKKQPHWDIFGSITSERKAASEHPLLWCQFTL